MEHLLESWSLIIILVSAFVIGWGAETAQTFMSRGLALSILAWLQTLPEFAVEANIAWHQERDLMIANLTGSLRLLVGLGWPMIFFTHFFFQGIRHRKFIKEIHLEKNDSIGVKFLFISIVYFAVILYKQSLTCIDSIFLIGVYLVYLYVVMKSPPHAEEGEEDLPWIGKKIVKLNRTPRIFWTTMLFVVGGVALYFSVDPFIHTLQKWSVTMGISTFVFIQWVAPFLSEFPEKVSAFNWARQKNKVPMAMMNMVNSNINQWTMLAAMIPIVSNLSLGRFEPVYLDKMHTLELFLTVAQSFLGGLLLLDLRFSIYDALIMFNLWVFQFINSSLREEIAIVYCIWIGIELIKILYLWIYKKQVPKALKAV